MFVENMADWIFKFSNLGMNDIPKDIHLFANDLVSHYKAIESMTHYEIGDWILKIY